MANAQTAHSNNGGSRAATAGNSGRGNAPLPGAAAGGQEAGGKTRQHPASPYLKQAYRLDSQGGIRRAGGAGGALHLSHLVGRGTGHHYKPPSCLEDMAGDLPLLQVAIQVLMAYTRGQADRHGNRRAPACHRSSRRHSGVAPPASPFAYRGLIGGGGGGGARAWCGHDAQLNSAHGAASNMTQNGVPQGR